METTIQRDVEYTYDAIVMKGAVCAPSGTVGAPGILLVHDAFGLSTQMLETAHRLAGLGFAVFAADVWGNRAQPSRQEEIGPYIRAMVSDRPGWAGRMHTAEKTAAAQPEIDGSSLVALGYCFGASSALELLRNGGGLRGVISIHAGLDLLDPQSDWSGADPRARVLICSGDEDPMATPPQRAFLQEKLSGVGIEWELDLYSGAKHAFTSLLARNSPTPDAVAYDERSAARAWAATTRFLSDINSLMLPAQS